MSRIRVTDPYYAKRAGEKGLSTEFIPPQYPAQVDPVQAAAQARLAEALQLQRAAEGANAAIDQYANNALLRGAGQPASPYETYRSARYGDQSAMTDPAGAARGMLPLGGGSGPAGSYNPAGIPASITGNDGSVRQAVQTGDPFFDVNTDFNQLERDRTLKNQNDAVFSGQNDRRLGAIAEQRQAADAIRAQNLRSQGMTQEQIDMRMHPERFAAPKDPAIEQAKAVDLAERQGRGNMTAIAQKLMRNGLSPAQAYAAAMNTIQTTDPNNRGAVPSLPKMDPMRIAAAMGAGPGMAAGNYGVGMQNADNNLMARGQESRDRRDVGMAQADATSQGGLMEFVMNLLKHKQGQELVGQQQSGEVRQRAIEWLNGPAGQAAANSPDPNQRALYQQMQQQATGVNSVAPGNQGAVPVQQPQTSAPMGNQQFLATNPSAMAQYLSGFPEGEQARRRAQMMVEGGFGGDASVQQYIHGLLGQQDPNLVGGLPDSWVSSYGDSAVPSFTGWLLGSDPLAQRGANWIEQNGGIPADVALQHARSFYNNR